MPTRRKKPKALWGWYPDRRIKPKVPDDLKAEVARRADELVRAKLRDRYIKPPSKGRLHNYPIELWTKWHRSFFYFGSTWACPFPDRISPTFELPFARIEYDGLGRFGIAYFRHTGKWWETERNLTLDQCLARVEEGGLYGLPV